MTKLQEAKELVSRYYADLDNAAPGKTSEAIRRYTADNYRWRGLHPFNELEGADAVADLFWEPFRSSIAPIQRRPDVFMAGSNEIDATRGTWVCCMGHLMGLFDRNWLGIPSTGKMLFFRFVEFHHVADGVIRETAHFFDIPSVMQQAGLQPFPAATGAFFITPGPKTHDGLLYDSQDPAESRQTMELIDRMINDLVGSGLESPQNELRATWHEDMIWFGPAGIGAAYTIPRYQDQHQGPFRSGLKDIEFLGHVCKFSEGRFGGFFGWPNLTMKPAGGFMGFPATSGNSDMRVVDIYRREGDLLAENWIFIDLLYFFYQQGVDILARMREICRT